jgi:hypothetical protein
MNKRKLLQKALTRPASLRFSELTLLAEAFGFECDRVSGSHHIYHRVGVPQLLNLQDVHGKAKAYQVKQLLALVETHDLALGEEP